MPNNTLEYLGLINMGLQSVRFSRCRDCGAYYPWFTTMMETGHPKAPQATTGPMLNGKEIRNCPCTKENNDLERSMG